LQSARLLSMFSKSEARTEAYAVIEAMTDALLADSILSPDRGDAAKRKDLVRAARDAHRVVIGGQPGKDRGTKIRLIAWAVQVAASLPHHDPDDKDARLVIGGAPYTSSLDWLLSELDQIDPAFEELIDNTDGEDRVARILARYRDRKLTTSAVIDA